MAAGLAALCAGYVLSQFFRAFLAVLAAPLRDDLGAGADDLALASGLWFLIFALMQLPVGWALDRIGPRRTASALLAIGGGGGAALFAMASAPSHIAVAMALIGVGCSPVLMASYYIFAREFPPARFATLAALMLGAGSVGNLVASYPMALAAETVGWRASLGMLAVASCAVAATIFVWVRDPLPAAGGGGGSLLDLLRIPAVWALLPLMLVNYAPSGALRGLWAGPYLTDVFGLGTSAVGAATLAMGVAMIAGTLAYGPLDRVLGTRKWVVFGGNMICAAALLALAALAGQSVALSVALIAAIGFFGASFPLIIAHGRSFFPPHLTGRGVTLLNLFGIGGAGLMQFGSGRIHTVLTGGTTATGPEPYAAIFTVFAVALLAGTLIYLLSPDRTD